MYDLLQSCRLLPRAYAIHSMFLQSLGLSYTVFLAQDCRQISKLLISAEVMDAITLLAISRVLEHRRLISFIERWVTPTSKNLSHIQRTLAIGLIWYNLM